MTRGAEYFVIWFPDAKRFLASNPLPQVPMIEAIGWRPWCWVSALDLAEKFSSEAAAELFLRGSGAALRAAFDEGEIAIRRMVGRAPPPLMTA